MHTQRELERLLFFRQIKTRHLSTVSGCHSGKEGHSFNRIQTKVINLHLRINYTFRTIANIYGTDHILCWQSFTSDRSSNQFEANIVLKRQHYFRICENKSMIALWKRK